MSGDEMDHIAAVVLLAEAELAAYLRGVQTTLGYKDTLQSGRAWIDTLESLAWPMNEYACFFRAISILTIARIVSCREENAVADRPLRRLRGESDEHERPFISA